ncbi:thiolase family protein [Ammoniphilus resinae]|uniref:acetyl-CoA C-acetyltransferase n=1 Tax=Ammoniphilus resinae TaxID=861532 RepID=A0ABS4GUY2_9BACL|nr:acetyl-CoA C-acetyltransferase [Ammoniphilus resinae]MBP1934061.1 acetyl-CoA C-acetyltransferase [Ammoniphilus resinae]
MENIVIVSGVRTAVGTFGGAFKTVSASDLGAIVIKEAVNRAGIDASQVDEVIMGCVGQFGEEAYLARVSAIKAGLPVETTAQTVNRLCSSGLQAIVTGMSAIQTGMAEIVVAGGAENMSRYPYLSRDMRWGARMGDTGMVDGLQDILSDPFERYSMGVTAENVAEEFEISRLEQDQFALESQQKAIRAIESGKFKEQIVPVPVKQRKGDDIIVDTDEHPKPNTTLETLGKLRTVFKKDGTVTAGNASGINDGAAAVVMMSESKARELGIKPLLTIVGAAVAGVRPSHMGTGPIPAVQKVLEKTGLTLDQIDSIESNEAFAAQALAVSKGLNLDPEKVNVNGGAIALGHPVGATGCLITVKLMYDLLERNLEYGLATLCIGGGQGLAVIYKNAQQ